MQENFFLVIEADSVPDGLAEFRDRHIDHPGRAVPFHTTLLGGISFEGLHRVEEVCSHCSAFQYNAVCVAGYPANRVLWLAPIPVSPFENLVTELYRALPEVERHWLFPTFHMTISVSRDATSMDLALQEFLGRFGNILPLHFEATEVAVWKERGQAYERLAAYPLRQRSLNPVLQRMDNP